MNSTLLGSRAYLDFVVNREVTATASGSSIEQTSHTEFVVRDNR